MAALRWILLGIGVAFLGAILWWESRRNARARAEGRGTAAGGAGFAGTGYAGDDTPREFATDDGLTSGAPPLPPAQRSPLALPPLAQMNAEPLMGDAIEFSDAFEPIRATREPLSVPLLPDPPMAAPAAPVVVDWPPEGERRILSLRLVPRTPERFAGRTLRQALEACGFVHGRLGIYHLPGEDGRAILSAAGLSRPGVLDPDNMDFQRFAGLNVFAVLPGALSAELTLDRLLQAAEDLAERSAGILQDEQGVPLDAAGVATLRQKLQPAPPDQWAGQGA